MKIQEQRGWKFVQEWQHWEADFLSKDLRDTGDQSTTLVSQGCYDKAPEIGELKLNSRNVLSHSSGA